MINNTDFTLTQRRRRLLGGKTGTRLRGDNGVSPPPRVFSSQVAPRRHPHFSQLAAAVRTRSVGPAALEWQDARLPLLGRLWARAWLPSTLLAASLVALMYLLQASGVAATGYDNQRLQIERDDWQLRNEQLRLELAKRRSLTWIESEATGRLGMVRAEPTALTYLKVAR
jgi:hypothetical protein